jgi:hypothetical protein
MHRATVDNGMTSDQPTPSNNDPTTKQARTRTRSTNNNYQNA